MCYLLSVKLQMRVRLRALAIDRATRPTGGGIRRGKESRQRGRQGARAPNLVIEWRTRASSRGQVAPAGYRANGKTERLLWFAAVRSSISLETRSVGYRRSVRSQGIGG